MSLYDSKQWLEDVDRITASLPFLEELAGKSVAITGVGGLICSAVADILIHYNETHPRPIEILAAARSERKTKDRFGAFFDRVYFHFAQYDATSGTAEFPLKADYIVHGASNASPDLIIREPVETMMSNFTGLLHLLEYGRSAGTTRLLYISSSEVYGKKEGMKPYREHEYGYVDLLNARNSYSVGKRAAETLCASFSDEYGLDSVIVRPGHIYGPTASGGDRRVSSAWAYAAARGETIVMKSDGAQLRSYCYCLDCAAAILTVLLRGESCRAYNISNPKSVISIKQMAEIMAKSAGVELRTELPTDEEKKGFNPMSNSSLDAASLMKLGWKGCFPAETGFAHTVQILRESGVRPR